MNIISSFVNFFNSASENVSFLNSASEKICDAFDAVDACHDAYTTYTTGSSFWRLTRLCSNVWNTALSAQESIDQYNGKSVDTLSNLQKKHIAKSIALLKIPAALEDYNDNMITGTRLIEKIADPLLGSFGAISAVQKKWQQNVLDMSPEERAKVELPIYETWYDSEGPSGSYVVGYRPLESGDLEAFSQNIPVFESVFSKLKIMEIVCKTGMISTIVDLFPTAIAQLQTLWSYLTTVQINPQWENDRVLQHCICPISLEIMRDPVSDNMLHRYERNEILRWLQTHNTSPLTRQILTVNMLIDLPALKAFIEDRMQHLRRNGITALQDPPNQILEVAAIAENPNLYG